MLKEHNHQFEVEEVSIDSDSSRHMSSPMSMPMTKNPMNVGALMGLSLNALMVSL